MSKGIAQQFTLNRNSYNGHFGKSKNKEEAFRFFKFVSENTDVEWQINGYQNSTGKHFVISTSHEEGSVSDYNASNKSGNLFISIHTHPNGPDEASGYSRNAIQNNSVTTFYGSNDATQLYKAYIAFQEANPNTPFERYPKFYVYNPKTKTRIRYDNKHSALSKTKITRYEDLYK